MPAPKKRSSKARNTARRIIPVVLITPATALGTYFSVSFVASPRHLYNAAQLEAASSRLRANDEAHRSYQNLLNNINKTALELSALSTQGSNSNQKLISISNEIESIKNTQAPTSSYLAKVGGSGSSTGVAPTTGQKLNSGATPSAPVITMPTQQPAAATTSASVLAAG